MARQDICQAHQENDRAALKQPIDPKLAKLGPRADAERNFQTVILNDDAIGALLSGGDEKTTSEDITFSSSSDNVLTALGDNTFQLQLSGRPGDRGGLQNRPPFEDRKQRLSSAAQSYFEVLRDANRNSELDALVERHHPEVLGRVNHKRPVTVVWYRHQGPACVAALARAGRVAEYRIPFGIDGPSREALLRAMEGVLRTHGNRALVADINRYRQDVYALAAESESLEHLAWLLLDRGLLHSLPADTIEAVS